MRLNSNAQDCPFEREIAGLGGRSRAAREFVDIREDGECNVGADTSHFPTMEVEMAADPEGLKIWKALYGAWHEVHEKALAGRAALNDARVQRAAGKGVEPGAARISEVERLERVAQKLAVELDTFVEMRLG
jgi:hypothetical protein